MSSIPVRDPWRWPAGTGCFRQRQQAPERSRLALRSASRTQRQRQRGATECKAAAGAQQGLAADKGRLELGHTLLSADSPRSKASACEALVKVGPLQLKPSVRRTRGEVQARDMGPSRYPWWWAVIATALLTVGCSHRAPAPRPFDAAVWKDKPRDFQDKRRCNMVDSLLRDHPLKGLSKAEVGALLGSQDDPSYFKSWDLRYWMGQQHGFMPIDSEWLVIRFEDGRVAEYAIVED